MPPKEKAPPRGGAFPFRASAAHEHLFGYSQVVIGVAQVLGHWQVVMGLRAIVTAGLAAQVFGQTQGWTWTSFTGFGATRAAGFAAQVLGQTQVWTWAEAGAESSDIRSVKVIMGLV